MLFSPSQSLGIYEMFTVIIHWKYSNCICSLYILYTYIKLRLDTTRIYYLWQQRRENQKLKNDTILQFAYWFKVPLSAERELISDLLSELCSGIHRVWMLVAVMCISYAYPTAINWSFAQQRETMNAISGRCYFLSDTVGNSLLAK